MTAATSPPPAPAPPKDRPMMAALWVLALLLGVFVAFNGVNAAIASLHQKQYSEARVAAVYLLSNGNAINRSMQRLHDVNVRDYNLVKGTQAALEVGDTSLFSRRVAQADVFGGEQRTLQREVQNYKAGFDKALNR